MAYDNLNIGDIITILNDDLEKENILEYTTQEIKENGLINKNKELSFIQNTARGIEYEVLVRNSITSLAEESWRHFLEDGAVVLINNNIPINAGATNDMVLENLSTKQFVFDRINMNSILANATLEGVSQVQFKLQVGTIVKAAVNALPTISNQNGTTGLITPIKGINLETYNFTSITTAIDAPLLSQQVAYNSTNQATNVGSDPSKTFDLKRPYILNPGDDVLIRIDNAITVLTGVNTLVSYSLSGFFR